MPSTGNTWLIPLLLAVLLIDVITIALVLIWG